MGEINGLQSRYNQPSPYTTVIATEPRYTCTCSGRKLHQRMSSHRGESSEESLLAVCEKSTTVWRRHSPCTWNRNVQNAGGKINYCRRLLVVSSSGNLWKFHHTFARPFFRISDFQIFLLHADDVDTIKESPRVGEPVDAQVRSLRQGV